jgi:hypothetical protein
VNESNEGNLRGRRSDSKREDRVILREVRVILKGGSQGDSEGKVGVGPKG